MTIDVPREIPAGRVILSFTPVLESTALHPCPVCARNIDLKTGNPNYNTETVAAIEEGIAISRGKISAKRFSSLNEMLEDLERDDPDD
ncbi:MAG: hypothetical protein LBU66_01440 [Treponema sp.]|nr:hypothetical protein [Treponema sp.]